MMLEHFRAIFDDMGEAKVREKLGVNGFNDKEARYAREWLRQLEEVRAAAQLERSEASQAEQASAASRAASAAERAADAAERANDIAEKANARAAVAIAVAAASAIVSIIALCVGK